jgi:phosphate transport system permease protein
MRPLLTEHHKDRLATVLIRTGGLLVILVVVGIVINIGSEAVPLFRRASQGPVEIVAEGGRPLVAGSDPRREVVWVLDRDGRIRFPRGSGLDDLEIGRTSTFPLQAADQEIHGLISAISEDGEVVVGRLRFRDSWEGDARRTTVRWQSDADSLILEGGRWAGVTTNGDEDGNLLVAAWTTEGVLSLAWWDAEDESWERVPSPPWLDNVHRLAIAEGLRSLSVLGGDGEVKVLRWPSLDAASVVGVEGPVAAVRFLIGGGTLIAVGGEGSVDVLLEVPRLKVENTGRDPLSVGGVTIDTGEAAVVPDDEIGQRFSSRPDVELSSAPSQWTVVRNAASLAVTPTVIAPASRRRGFAIGGEDGSVAIYYSTSGRRLLQDRWTDRAISALVMDPKGDGAVAIGGRAVLRRSVDNPHPEISFRTLFLPVWYEGYAARKWVWQSTGGSDAFEPKLSVWPLIFGTLKATLYAMLVSLPLALFAAVYVSQLAPRWIQTTVKPTLELMAAVPSVVVGFLAALWLAPRLEAALLAVLIGAVALPFSIVLALGVWRILAFRTASSLSCCSHRVRRSRRWRPWLPARSRRVSSVVTSSDFSSPNGVFATTSATASWSASASDSRSSR